MCSGKDCIYYETCDWKKVAGEKKCEYYGNKPTAYKPRRLTPYERTRAQVYATGNKWAIENFNATH